MATNQSFCHILNGNVTIISNINGDVTNVVCPEFNRIKSGCNLKIKSSSGFLDVALKLATDKISDGKMKMRTCEFITSSPF